MKAYLRLEAVTKYPDWHRQPLHLTTNEMNEPWLAIKDFFNVYHLNDIRQDLKQLFEDATEAEEPDIKDHLYTIENLHRLTEAAWLLYRKRIEEKEIEMQEDDGVEEVTTHGGRFFAKRLRLMDKVHINPNHSLQEVFTHTSMDSLKTTVRQWMQHALGNELNNYCSSQQRAALMEFCNRFNYLVEAGYVIARTSSEEEKRGINIGRYNQLRTELMELEKVELLSPEEISAPGLLVKQFFERFPILRARAELWDLLEAAIVSNDKAIDRRTVLMIHECLLTLVEALWRLQKEKKKTSVKKPRRK